MKLCDELNGMCARFWWVRVGEERKIHWKRWDKLSISKKEGGMGFQDLRDFNLAMLAKQGWRLIQGNDSLLYRCFKVRYFPRSSFLEAKESTSCSYVWRSMMVALPILRLGSCWRVGNGSSISVVGDRWLSNHPTNKIMHPRHELVEDLAVSDLINLELHAWRRDMIMGMFLREDAKAICRIPLSRRSVLDSIIWIHNKNGKFAVKSAYKLARRTQLHGDRAETSSGCAGKIIWPVLWKLKIPNKVNNSRIVGMCCSARRMGW